MDTIGVMEGDLTANKTWPCDCKVSLACPDKRQYLRYNATPPPFPYHAIWIEEKEILASPPLILPSSSIHHSISSHLICYTSPHLNHPVSCIGMSCAHLSCLLRQQHHGTVGRIFNARAFEGCREEKGMGGMRVGRGKQKACLGGVGLC